MSKGSPDVCQFLSNNSQVFPVFSPPADDVSKINDIVYGVISPVIIIFGIVGDVLTVYTLTHPLLRKSSIVYTYLTLLAMTDLLTQLSVIPMILFLQGRVFCSEAAAFYYAHIGFPLANALMGSSVYIIIFLTLSQYMAVCRPFTYGMRSRKICFILFAVAYFCNFCLNAPWALKKTYHEIPLGYREALQLSCPYVICDDVDPPAWYKPYESVREACCRIVPFFVLVFLNANILITYRNTKQDRMKRLTTSQKRFVTEKSEKEEKRLFTLLFAICIVFFVCTIPAAPLAIFVSDTLSKNLQFQIFRAVVNLLEFTKFALNFYFYCLINPEIRNICSHVITCKKLHRPARVKGQPMTPISMYTRSTKSRELALNGATGTTTGTAESRRSSTNQDGRSKPSSLKKNGMRDRANTVVQADVLADKLTVIRESETDDVGDKI